MSDQDQGGWARWLAVLFVVGGCVYWTYCYYTRPPVIESSNLKYVQLLMTAVSSRQPESVARVSQSIQQQHEQGEMSAQEQKSLQRIIDMTSAGSWDEAYQECFRLAEGQLNRTRRPAAQPVHSHPHNHSHPEGHSHDHGDDNTKVEKSK